MMTDDGRRRPTTGRPMAGTRREDRRAGPRGLHAALRAAREPALRRAGSRPQEPRARARARRRSVRSRPRGFGSVAHSTCDATGVVADGEPRSRQNRRRTADPWGGGAISDLASSLLGARPRALQAVFHGVPPSQWYKGAKRKPLAARGAAPQRRLAAEAWQRCRKRRLRRSHIIDVAFERPEVSQACGKALRPCPTRFRSCSNPRGKRILARGPYLFAGHVLPISDDFGAMMTDCRPTFTTVAQLRPNSANTFAGCGDQAANTLGVSTGASFHHDCPGELAFLVDMCNFNVAGIASPFVVDV